MARGQLRIYLGAAPGVGKTFAMLNEGRRRAERGTDVVVGIVETHGRSNTLAQLGALEVVPRKQVEYRGASLEELDLDAVLARHPEQVLVDELAHTNVPGGRHEKRWQDIEEILDAGIDVISTVNIQHLESLNDVVARITGITQRETVPDAWVRAADQIELVDMSPEALRRRMAHGNIYPEERIEAALGNYFREGNLGALRELALLWLADRVDEDLSAYRQRHGIDLPWETRERVVVAITGAPGGDDLVRRASRMAVRAHGEFVAVHVRRDDGGAEPSRALLDRHRQLAEELGGRYLEVAGDDPGRALVEVARAENATQIVLGASRRSRLRELAGGSVINRVLRDAGPIDVHVISTVADPADPAFPRPTRWGVALPARRRTAGWVAALLLPPAVAAVLVPWRDGLGLESVLLLLLATAVGVAAVGGAGPALLAALSSFLLANWFFTPPIHTWTVAEAEQVLALAVFLAVTGLVSAYVAVANRRTAEANRARAEAISLGRGNDLRSALLSAVSHDLRTPLAGIKASISSLLADDVEWSPEAVREFHEAIDADTDRLAALVADLLDMSRISSRSLTVQWADVGIDELLPAAIASLGEHVPADRLEIDVAESLPRVRTDPVLVERALANLLANAVAWSPVGQTVAVRAAIVGEDLVVRIVDHGPGIPADQRERIFRPFQRLGDDQRSNPGGVGLGLAVARGFVEAVGGEVSVEDTAGGGTTMAVALPMAGMDDHEPVMV